AGPRLASSGDQAVRVWDVTRLERGRPREVATYKGHIDTVVSVAFSPDGKELATGSADGTARVWGPGQGQEWEALAGASGYVGNLAFAGGGKVLVTATGSGTVRLWDMPVGRARATLLQAPTTADSTSPYPLATTPRGDVLACAGLDRRVQVRELPTGKVRRVLGREDEVVFALALSPDGKKLAGASANRDGQTARVVRVWDVETGAET